MTRDRERLRRCALHRYECGRLKAALRFCWFVPPLVGLSGWCCGRPGVAVACGVGLLSLLVALGWRGQGFRRAIAPGLLAGGVPFTLALFARLAGHPCLGDAWCTVALAVCSLGGVVCAALLGVMREREQQPGPWAATLLVAGLTGALGCVLAGLAGVLGMLAGFAAGAAPMYWALRARRW